jgi:hypothetical protein
VSQLFARGLFDAATAGLVPPSGGGTGTFLRADGSWAATSGGGGAVADGDYGDVTVSGTGAVWTVDNLPESRITGLVSDLTTLAAGVAAAVPQTRTLSTDGLVLIDGGTSAALTANRALSIAITALTAALNQFTSSLQGLVPASGGGTANFLRADGSWASPTASFFDVELTPAQIILPTNDWAPGTLGQVTLINVTSDATRTVTGLVGGADGLIVCLLNVNATGSNTPSYSHENAGSAAGNRFHNAGASARTGGSSGCVWYRYSAAAARWLNIMDTQ